MVFDDGSHIRPCSNFGRRVSVSTDRSTPIRRTGVVADRAPRVPPDEDRARPCVTRSTIVCYKPTVSTLLLLLLPARDNVFINSNTPPTDRTHGRKLFREFSRYRRVRK